jgi:hypothetical protein
MRAERSGWNLSARCVRFGSLVDSQVTTTDCASDPEVVLIVTCETIGVGVGVGDGLPGRRAYRSGRLDSVATAGLEPVV